MSNSSYINALVCSLYDESQEHNHSTLSPSKVPQGQDVTVNTRPNRTTPSSIELTKDNPDSTTSKSQRKQPPPSKTAEDGAVQGRSLVAYITKLKVSKFCRLYKKAWRQEMFALATAQRVITTDKKSPRFWEFLLVFDPTLIVQRAKPLTWMRLAPSKFYANLAIIPHIVEEFERLKRELQIAKAQSKFPPEQGWNQTKLLCYLHTTTILFYDVCAPSIVLQHDRRKSPPSPDEGNPHLSPPPEDGKFASEVNSVLSTLSYASSHRVAQPGDEDFESDKEEALLSPVSDAKDYPMLNCNPNSSYTILELPAELVEGDEAYTEGNAAVGYYRGKKDNAETLQERDIDYDDISADELDWIYWMGRKLLEDHFPTKGFKDRKQVLSRVQALERSGEGSQIDALEEEKARNGRNGRKKVGLPEEFPNSWKPAENKRKRKANTGLSTKQGQWKSGSFSHAENSLFPKTTSFLLLR
ncbi:unnamed protein product [Cylindrotheca closterium]|uniref:Uncharacterized protein n=1 Tax=Cylindrotheca closterium TaxID=2856 RepID=A0AAD2G107_9STRA|nr:unnamed protein product [Cylindrotheca closterium]